MILALAVILAQMNITVSAPDSALTGTTFTVKVVVSSSTLLPPTIVPPGFQGFSIIGTTDAASVVRDGGVQRVVVQRDYLLQAPRAATHTIGSFEAKLDGKTLRAPPFKIVIHPPPNRRYIQLHAEKIDSSKVVSIDVRGTPDTVFVGQQATYQVAVYVDEAFLRQRAARNPTFTPPDLRGTLSYELPPMSNLIPSRIVGGRTFRPHVYQRAIFPLVPGIHVVPAATLDYTLPRSGNLLSGEETHSLRADSVVIVARSLPTAGRPSDFAGPVGTFSVERSISGMKLRVGDPFTLRVRVLGAGNIKLLPRPALSIPWADVLPAGERIELQMDDGRVRGGKQFEWVVTPRDAGTQELPAIRYAYFDPSTKRYAVAVSAPESIAIVPGTLLATDDSVVAAKTALAIRKTYQGEKAAPLWSNPILLIVAIVSPAPALFALLLGLRQRRARTKVAVAKAPTFSAIGQQQGATAISDARRLFLSSVERRLGLTKGLSATEGGFRAALLRSGVSRETTAEAEALVRALDTAVFGAGGVADNSLIERAARSFQKIDEEAAGSHPGSVGHTVPVILLLCASLFAQNSGTVTTAFDRGVKFYESGSYADAAEQFLEITRVLRRAPDAWVNLGAAAWESGDTAAAMVAWQRALRLEPTARDVRANIRLMSQSNSRDAWLIPAVPPDVVTVVALAAWIALWALAFRSVAKRGSVSPVPLALSALLALGLGAYAFDINRRIADRDVAVVTHDVVSHAMPSLESTGLTRLSPGEVVRLTQSERDWSRVELDGRAAGWLHHSHLLRVVID